MTSVDRRNLRIMLLLCAAKAPLGLTLETAKVVLNSKGFRSSGEDIQAEITYLVDKGWMAELTKRLSPEIRSWRVTAEGRDFLAQEGFDE